MVDIVGMRGIMVSSGREERPQQDKRKCREMMDETI